MFVHMMIITTVLNYDYPVVFNCHFYMYYMDFLVTSNRAGTFLTGKLVGSYLEGAKKQEVVQVGLQLTSVW